ncbi:helix-turn-helix domain-containing protein [Microbacterium dauci]|uniref:Helix-turn-helix transcriptional regulator n=1 Tax=Microbacterium dauci TaxID=3048008 RepID=A0ABT6ZDK5_9MICO|nr:helix-turn-helix transcriptional regulator [Microbacterium sp. LX3-4]MDJ1113805.1 helix-turn-helix transcriptional regulator [Microbacterium sp. LX3-4]
MMQSLRRVAASLNPVRARAKVLARENREMRTALIRIRREANLSQSDVAERLGVSQQAIHKLERYDADPRLSTLERYANAVGALVLHRVVVDHGQSIRLAQSSPWGDRHSKVAQRVHVIRMQRTGTLDGWVQSEAPREAVQVR